MSINQSGWRPTSPEANTGNVPASVTGNKALMLEEALIFEIGDGETTGVDFDTFGSPANAGAQGTKDSDYGPGFLRSQENKLGGLLRTAPIGLPGLSEPETVRHYTRL